MSSLGIYFGPRLLSLVESDGRKLLGNVNIPLAAVAESSPTEEKVPEQIKIATVISDEMRKNGIAAKSADIVLPGKELIIRTFQMPILSPEELANAVRFEAKKYIPFKVEDLVSDFQVKVDRSTRKNFILFVGMKKDNLDKYVSVFNRLNLKLNSVEYSGFAILRLLKLAKVKTKGIVALINIDLAEDDEVNFVVLEDDFPLFSRDITLAGETTDLLHTAKPELAESLEKLKIELRISLDFYLRKFPTKNIQNVIFIAPDDYRAELEAFIKERGLAARTIQCAKLYDKPVSFSSSFLKAFACAMGKAVKGAFSIDLLPGKAKKHAAGGLPALSAIPILSQIRVDFRMVALGAMILAAPYFIHYYQKQPLVQQLTIVRESRPKVKVASPDADLSVLQEIDSGYKEKIKTVRKLLESRRLLTPPLDTIPRAGVKGLWLSSISFAPDGGGYTLVLSGSVYLGDGSRELEAVDLFLSDLRKMPEFGQIFPNISLISADQGQSGDVFLTNFRISCRSQ